MPVKFLVDGPDGAPLTVALAHGAGVAMDSPFMTTIAEGLAAAGLTLTPIFTRDDFDVIL